MDYKCFFWKNTNAGACVLARVRKNAKVKSVLNVCMLGRKDVRWRDGKTLAMSEAKGKTLQTRVLFFLGYINVLMSGPFTAFKRNEDFLLNNQKFQTNESNTYCNRPFKALYVVMPEVLGHIGHPPCRLGPHESQFISTV